MLFETTRAPFVIKHDGDRLEVPWRDGAGTRSARREDLLRLLVPQIAVPRFDVLSCNLYITAPNKGSPHWFGELNLQLYAHAPLDAAIIIPEHTSRATISGVPTVADEVELKNLRLSGAQIYGAGPVAARFDHGPEPASVFHTVHTGDKQVIIAGPGIVHGRAIVNEDQDRWSDIAKFSTDLYLRLRMDAIDVDRSLTVDAQLRREVSPTGASPRWVLRRHRPSSSSPRRTAGVRSGERPSDTLLKQRGRRQVGPGCGPGRRPH
jgi:hypothetical protein